MRYDELDVESKKLMEKCNVSWNPARSVYMTDLHKDFYLYERELRSRTDLEEFCRLISYLNEHLEYGVNADWASSNLNFYVYLANKEWLRSEFPYVIESLSRFYKDSDIINFYKMQTNRPSTPTIIDLIGTTGAVSQCGSCFGKSISNSGFGGFTSSTGSCKSYHRNWRAAS
ncbi:MAG: hypothetical protein PHF24_09680 [Syntrophomonas sp.]|nr:hypothetical protein [Syntrophomonas sp.]